MTEVQKAIRDKVIKKLDEIPERIVVTVVTEQEGGSEPTEPGGEPGRQHGGPVTAGRPYTVGEAGPEVFIPDRPGLILPNWALNLPATAAGGGGGVALGPSTNINLTMNPVINNGMDVAEFKAMTLHTIQQAIRGE